MGVLLILLIPAKKQEVTRLRKTEKILGNAWFPRIWWRLPDSDQCPPACEDTSRAERTGYSVLSAPFDSKSFAVRSDVSDACSDSSLGQTDDSWKRVYCVSKGREYAAFDCGRNRWQKCPNSGETYLQEFFLEEWIIPNFTRSRAPAAYQGSQRSGILPRRHQ